MLISFNPTTREEVGRVAVTPEKIIEECVAQARHAQAGWAALSVSERKAALCKVATLLRDRRERLAELVTLEMGKPLGEARAEVAMCLDTFESRLDEIEEAQSATVMASESIRTTILRDPLGVVACITPWNYPILMPHQGFLPALMAGNTVVFKPSELVPLAGQAYAEVYREALPEGVVRIIHGADSQGKALVAAEVDLIVFTGSRAAGKHIFAQASGRLTRVILELGGKDPLIVLGDADVQRAARFAASNSFRNAGQVCVSTERIYVAEEIHDAFVNALAAAAGRMVVGDGREPGVRIGPMVSSEQRDHVAAQVEEALEDGARVAWRGECPGGNFFAPVILTEVREEMALVRDETFGPVAAVMRFSEDADAIRRANDTPYGLGAVVFGAPDRAREVARQLTAGMIGVNQGLASAGATPWVGARESGYGFHSGAEGHRQFTQVRVLNERLF